MKTLGRRHIQHLRAGPGQRPADVVSELAHLAWRTLTETPELKALDPHRWGGIFTSFRGVFKGRLVRYRGCGEREECRTSLKSVAGERPIPSDEWGGLSPVYTLEIGRDLDRLSRLLAGLACRRLRPSPLISGRKAARRRLAGILRDVLGERIYRGDSCAECPVLKGERERRLWPEEEGSWRARDSF